MIPHEPPRQPQYGFLYFPPYRIQGYSIAGEESFVQVPELDVCFDIGRAPRLALPSNYIALTHGHMDHTAGLAYYFSQRVFQGMGPGTILCCPSLATAIEKMMQSWVDVEAQRTQYNVVAMQPGTPTDEYEIKNNLYLRAYDTIHTVPSLGFVVVEKRSKLQEQYVGLPQEKLTELKTAGTEITYTKEVPLVAYTGDTGPGAHFEREDLRAAKILVTECTFLDTGHRGRAKVGKHLHIDDIIDILDQVEAEAIVLTHLSRRTHLGQARDELDMRIPKKHRDRVFLFMDTRTNRERYRRQAEEAEAAAK